MKRKFNKFISLQIPVVLYLVCLGIVSLKKFEWKIIVYLLFFYPGFEKRLETFTLDFFQILYESFKIWFYSYSYDATYNGQQLQSFSRKPVHLI